VAVRDITKVIKPVLRLVRKPSGTAGLPPGTPVFVGEKKALEVTISIIDYDGGNVEYKEHVDIRECLPYRERPSVTWINVEGLHRIAPIEELGRGFGLHPLTVEDILNTRQRPKVEIFDEYAFVSINMSSFDEETGALEAEHASLVFGENYVLTFQEQAGSVFDSVKARINQRGRITRQGADYLAYNLLDTIVDNYFGILEQIDDSMADLEVALLGSPGPETLEGIYLLKRQIITLSRTAWPLREIINGLQKSESGLINDSTKPYLRDLNDHAIQVIETLETHREMIGGMFEIYLASVNNRLNDIMRFLTIFATIFIPLTFITGIYGMNFKYMPELGWRWGYFGALGAMALLGVSLLIIFKRKRWL